MGFFFFDKKQKTKQQKYVKRIAKEQGCGVCPLRGIKGRSTKPIGDDNPDLYVVSLFKLDEWEQENIKENFPTSMLIRFGTLVRCKTRFQNKEIPISCCGQYLLKDIEEQKPEIVLGLGITVLNFFTKRTDLESWRGRRIPCKEGEHTFWFYPSYDHYFIEQRDEKALSRGHTGTYERTFEKDCMSIVHLYERNIKPNVVVDGYFDGIEVITGENKNDIEKVIKQLNEFKREPEIAVDIETIGLRPFFEKNKMISIAIGTDKKVISFPIDHPGNPWDDQIITVKEAVKDFILNSKKKIAHYLKFELEWFLHYFGDDIIWGTDWEDTAGLAYVTDERSGSILSLDNRCFNHFGFGLKALTGVDRSNLEKIKIDKLLLYGGLDAKYTYKLYHDQLNEFDESLKYIYDSTIGAIKSLAIAMNRGLMLDRPVWKQFEKDFSRKIRRKDRKMRCLPEVREMEKKLKANLNLRSSKQLTVVFRDILGLVQVKPTKGGGYSTDKEVLDVWAEKGIELAVLIKEYRQLTGKYSKYFVGFESLLDKNDYIHPEFNTYIASTGRLSSGQDKTEYS